MKTIQVTDEIHEFLINLSTELNKQNNRCTASPYFFQVETDDVVPVADGCGKMGWYGDGEILYSEQEIKEAIFEYHDWDIEADEHNDLYDELGEGEIESILEENYRRVFFGTTKIYENAFLTEKACKDHIRANRHHYRNPQDYLTYSDRNPELETLLEFLKSLTPAREVDPLF